MKLACHKGDAHIEIVVELSASADATAPPLGKIVSVKVTGIKVIVVIVREEKLYERAQIKYVASFS